VDEALHVDAILNTIRRSSLTAKDAERVVSALKDQELIETAVTKTAPGSESLIAFLERFWDL
jgi:hypothetical protein